MAENTLIMNELLPSIGGVLEGLGNDIISQYRRKLYEGGHNTTGQLGNTLKLKVEQEDDAWSLYLIIQDYWKWIEEGRPSGSFPNIDALKKWIKQKPIVPTVTNGKLPTIDQLAYLIGRSIKENGTPAHHYLQDILDKIDWKSLEESITKDISNTVDNQILTEL